MIEVTSPGYECSRCSHQWVPRNKARPPKVCPKCKSPYWDRPRSRADLVAPEREGTR